MDWHESGWSGLVWSVGLGDCAALFDCELHYFQDRDGCLCRIRWLDGYAQWGIFLAPFDIAAEFLSHCASDTREQDITWLHVKAGCRVKAKVKGDGESKIFIGEKKERLVTNATGLCAR